jgi:hypothetical protein
MVEELNRVDMQFMATAERIFAGQGEPMIALQNWLFSKLRDLREPVDPTAFATDMLIKAMQADTNKILTLCNDMAIASRMEDKDIVRVKKQVMEVIRIRNNLAIMLDRSEVSDPRQFDLFREQEALRPEDFR